MNHNVLINQHSLIEYLFNPLDFRMCSNEEELSSTQILDNLQEQEYEMTALTEIICDSNNFTQIDFNNELFSQHLNSSTGIVSDAENYSTSQFFKSVFENNNSDRNVETRSKLYQKGGILRISPDMQHILGDSDSDNHITINCQKFQKQNERTDELDNSSEKDSSTSSHSEKQNTCLKIKIRYLSPIVLSFALPCSYPSNSPPDISLYCSWLNADQLARLKENLTNIWKEGCGSVILFTWQSFIQDELVSCLELFQNVDIITSTVNDKNQNTGNLTLDISKAVQEEIFRIAQSESNNDEKTSKSSKDLSDTCEHIKLSQTSKLRLENSEIGQCNDKTLNGNLEKSSHLLSSVENRKQVQLNRQPNKEVFYGVVKKYFDQKGYGFIRIFGDGLKRIDFEKAHPKSNLPDKNRSKYMSKKTEYSCDGSTDEFWWDVYFHISGFQNHKQLPNSGMEVEFELIDDNHKKSHSRDLKTKQSSFNKGDKDKRYRAIKIAALPQRPISQNGINEICASVLKSDKIDEAASNSQITKSNSKCDKNLSEINCVMNIFKYLQEFNELEEEKQFNTKVYLCLVCFAEKLGSICMKFPNCNHVYCSDCMKEYFRVQIGEGMMNNIVCPNDGCDSRALPNQVIHKLKYKK